ncbi:MAG TPA: phosphoglycerate dehydrogenase [Virgibacillus sp.]|nr:phosphoglycerate dehydrogenase [Virgibacillus sp.]
MTYKVLVADPLSEEGLIPLREAEGIEVVVETDLSKEALLKRIKDFDALLVRSQTQVTAEVIASGTRLKVVGRAGVGVDNIDLKAATANGVIVVNAPNANINSAAEHTIAMLMALARNIPQAYHSLQHKEWDRKSYVGVELKGKTLGIIGLGRIGTEVSARAIGQRMKVIAYDPFLTEEKAGNMGIDCGTLEEVVKTADFITVHTPLLKETRHIINADTFKLMKDDVRIINCARGGIIDEDALYDAIVSGKVAGAAIDVFEEEPATDHKLLELNQVIATPHLGASTVEAQEGVAVDVSEDVVTILSGGLALHPVNIPSVPQEIMKKIEPYFHLSEKLGKFLSRLEDEMVEELNVYYAGDLTELEVGPITRNAVKGLLRPILGTRVNNINAAYLATKKGISVHESRTTNARGFTNLLTVEIKTKSTKRTVVGTLLNGLGERIVRVDNYSMDVAPAGNMIMIHHKDQPGAIGRVGTFLAENNINIATMQVGRSEAGGEAIMMLSVDKPLEKEKLDDVLKLTEINKVTSIEL